MNYALRYEKISKALFFILLMQRGNGQTPVKVFFLDPFCKIFSYSGPTPGVESTSGIDVKSYRSETPFLGAMSLSLKTQSFLIGQVLKTFVSRKCKAEE